MTEGDVLTVFSQWGEIADVSLPRDKETGKTRGFGGMRMETMRSRSSRLIMRVQSRWKVSRVESSRVARVTFF
jgi:hypothetical protein